MGSLDTNALIYWLNDSTPDKAGAVELLINGSDQLKVADAVFLELEYHLRKQIGMPREAIAQNMLLILDNPKLVSRQKLFNLVIEAYLRHPKLSFVDCYLAHFAKETGNSPLHTFDRKLYLQLPDLATKIVA
jgi:predicted nucleic acid-binding protein